jgi:hypothetical protein
MTCPMSSGRSARETPVSGSLIGSIFSPGLTTRAIAVAGPCAASISPNVATPTAAPHARTCRRPRRETVMAAS